MENPIFIQQSGRWVKLREYYLWVSAVVLILAGVSKTMGLQKPAAFLSNPNSVFSFLSNKQLILGASFVEVSIGILLIASVFELASRTKMLFWIASLFAIYRSILIISKEPEPCRCFGQIFDLFHLDDSMVNFITNSAFLFLWIPSGLLVIADFYASSKNRVTAD
jgi:hypothetical protein